MQLADFSSSVWSVLPPLLALGLAIVTRKVLLSLSAGIIVGALMLTDGNLIGTFDYLTDRITSLIYSFDENQSFTPTGMAPEILAETPDDEMP